MFNYIYNLLMVAYTGGVDCRSNNQVHFVAVVVSPGAFDVDRHHWKASLEWGPNVVAVTMLPFQKFTFSSICAHSQLKCLKNLVVQFLLNSIQVLVFSRNYLIFGSLKTFSFHWNLFLGQMKAADDSFLLYRVLFFLKYT